jgi:hypothetical protein
MTPRSRRCNPVALAGAVLAILLHPTPSSAGEPPADGTAADTVRVLAGYAEAMGGRERWQSIERMVLRGRQVAFSEEHPFVATYARGKFRLDCGYMKEQVTFAWDGLRGWWRFPFFGYPWATPAPAAEARWFSREAGGDLPLLAWRDAGHQVAATASSFEGQPAWQVQVQFGPGDDETWYLDRQTHLPLARRYTAADFGQAGEWWVYWSDYREVHGLTIAHRVELEGQTRHLARDIEAVEIGEGTGEDPFALPLGEEIERLAGLTGRWDVAWELKPHPRAPWSPAVSVASEVTPVAGGLLWSESFTADRDGIPAPTVRQWSFDRAAGRFRVTEIDALGGILDVFEGKLDPAAPAALELRNDPTAGDSPGQSRQRWRVRDLGQPGMVIEIDLSRDGGATWQEVARATYQRRPASG